MDLLSSQIVAGLLISLSTTLIIYINSQMYIYDFIGFSVSNMYLMWYYFKDRFTVCYVISKWPNALSDWNSVMSGESPHESVCAKSLTCI